MNLEQFHHSIRAAREVLRSEGASGAIVIMGSQKRDIQFVDTLVISRLTDPMTVRELLGEIEDVRSSRAVQHLDRIAARGLPESQRHTWHTKRGQAIADRRARTTEQSPADALKLAAKRHR